MLSRHAVARTCSFFHDDSLANTRSSRNILHRFMQLYKILLFAHKTGQLVGVATTKQTGEIFEASEGLTSISPWY